MDKICFLENLTKKNEENETFVFWYFNDQVRKKVCFIPSRKENNIIQANKNRNIKTNIPTMRPQIKTVRPDS